MIVTPLNRLTRKEVKWEWSKDYEKSFQKLKKKLTTALVYQDKVLKAQQKNDKVNKIISKVESGVENPFQILKDGMIIMDRHMYLLDDNALKVKVLKEAYESKFDVHPGSTKMYKDLKKFYWWPNINK